MRYKPLFVGTIAAALLAAAPARADVVTLTFEGVGNLANVGNFYNGGTDSAGNSGTNYGVAFSGSTLGVIDADAGGGGNFANEPSPNTIMFFLDANNGVLNVASGFDTGFSFFYSSSTAAVVNVFSGLNATGDLLGSIALSAQHTRGCTGDPTGTFCNWTNVGVSFAGLARSIDFGGTANQTGYDNITFGSAVAGGVPEPGTWAMMLIGFALTGATIRRRRSTMTVNYA